MSPDQTSDGPCGAETCSVDWLFNPAGPSDPEWRARISAELAAPRWSLHWSCCINCTTTSRRHLTGGRCTLCYGYWRRNGKERPPERERETCQLTGS